jgi:hypothetical protein
MDTVGILFLVICGIPILILTAMVPRIVRLEREAGVVLGMPIPRRIKARPLHPRRQKAEVVWLRAVPPTDANS